MLNRKNMPKFAYKLSKNKLKLRKNVGGLLAACQPNTKEVRILSNCYDKCMTKHRQTDGTLPEVKCPITISFYNSIVRGLDLGN